MSKTNDIKHVPKDVTEPQTLTITVEVPKVADSQNFIRAEIAYLKNLMVKFPGPAKRFYEELKIT